MSQLKILAPTRYPWHFNGPRESRHAINIRTFIPFNKLTPKLEGFTVFGASPITHFDLIHAFNRIPLGTTPFVIGCEAHLPRAFGLEQTRYYQWLNRSLQSPRCRRIVAISKHALNVIRKQHAHDDGWDAIAAKTEIRYPNLVLPTASDRAPLSLDPVRVIFVGAHFGRKGGAVAVKLAERALKANFPLHVTIVSNLQVGGGIWTDPVDDTVFDRYFKLLELPNVTYLGSLDNAAVRHHLAQSHFSILTTFSDTFGYSAIESMAHHTPVIATNQGALPEFIEHGKNGLLLDLDTNDVDEWKAIDRDHTTAEFAKYYVSEIERLADETFEHIVDLAASPARYRSMRQEARRTTEERFNHRDASRFWDDLYDRSVQSA